MGWTELRVRARRIAALARVGLAGLGLALPLGCDRAAEPPPTPVRPIAEAAVVPGGAIVSLSPVATGFVLGIGAGAGLVGVDAASSARIPGAEDLPVIDLASARALAPRLVLVPALPPDGDPAARALQADGARLVEFAPHDLEDVFALCRGLGAELVGIAAATSFERRIARPLALIAGQSPPRDRLRVVAVVGFDPLTLAGGHSFETDLIEIAGASSATHGGDEPEIAATPERWTELAPDLVLVTSGTEMTEAARASAFGAIPDRYPVEFFHFDRETFWLEEPELDAARLRGVIVSVEQELLALGRPPQARSDGDR